MIAIIVHAIIMLMMMARKPRRGRDMSRYIRGNIDLNMVVGLLTGETLTSTNVADAVVETTRVTSLVATYGLAGYTPTVGVGPLIIGVAHSDYTDAEIEEWVELTTGWDGGDLVSREVARRKIKRIGTFRMPNAVGESSVLNDGKMIRTKLGWKLFEGDNLNFWVYNPGVTVATTSPDISVAGHANLFGL